LAVNRQSYCSIFISRYLYRWSLYNSFWHISIHVFSENLRWVIQLPRNYWGRCGIYCIVVGYTTTCAISTYHHLSCEFESCW